MNESGFTVNAMNFDMPSIFPRRAGSNDGTPVSQPGVHVGRRSAEHPVLRPVPREARFCNPTTDVPTCSAPRTSALERRCGEGPERCRHRHFTKAGGWLGGLATNLSVIANVTGSSLKLSEHSVGVFLVDATTNRLLSLKYGLAATTMRTAGPNGEVTSYRRELPREPPPGEDARLPHDRHVPRGGADARVDDAPDGQTPD